MTRAQLMWRAGMGLVFSLWFTCAWATDVILQLPPEAQGLDGQLRRASLSVETAETPDATAQDLMAAARADYGRMVGALYAVGRYGGVVSILVDGQEAANISPFARKSAVGQIIIRVQPGPQFTFSQARVAPLAPGTELPEGFKPGAPAFSEFVSDAARAGTTGWQEAGHAKVALRDQRITANHSRAELSADIVLDPGPRLTFGNLVIRDPGGVRPERVRQIAGLPTGQVYSPAELKKATDRLRQTGAFQSVVLEEADRITPGNSLDINATLVPSKPRRIGFGGEISSLEGLTLTGFWLHRNLFGGAERLRLEGEIGGIGGNSGGTDYIFSARYERPATFTPDTDLLLGGRIQELNEPDYRERSVRIGAGLSHTFNDRLSVAGGIDYQYSDIDDALGSRQLEHIFLPLKVTYDDRDEPLDATTGAFMELEVTPLVGLDNDSLGARVFLDSRTYYAFGENDRFVLAARGQIGTVNGAGLTELPPEMVFFSGGAGTVRGQPYQSLGIPLLAGTQVGGRSFAAVSAELRAKVKGNWSVVGFADTAFVGQDSWWDGFTGSHSGAGLGVRYDTGVGPIRVDVATPLDSDAGEDFELYVGIGQAF